MDIAIGFNICTNSHLCCALVTLESLQSSSGKLSLASRVVYYLKWPCPQVLLRARVIIVRDDL